MHLEVKKGHVFVLIITALIIYACYTVSVPYNIPLLFIARNFVIPTLLILVGISKDTSSLPVRLAWFIPGIVLYSYMTLHYIIGFHNPYWG